MQIFPVFIPQKGCPFECIYCSQEEFSAVKEVPFDILSIQIEAFCRKHQAEDKQIAFYGGTFTGLPLNEREKYYQLIKPFLDGKTTLRISTRPDCVDEEDLIWCKTHGVKTIELGIQDFSDKVLKASGRSYDRATAMDACFRVKEYGFELGVQLMPGLPQSDLNSRRESSESLRRVSPRYLRLYPLIVLRGTKLWDDYQEGKYTPLSLDEAIEICAEYYELAEQIGTEIIKTGIPPLEKSTEYAGPYHPAFGELVKGEILIRKIVNLYKGEDTLQLSYKDISLLTGHDNYGLKKLKKRLDLCNLNVKPDSSLPEGEIRFIQKDLKEG
jgi:histone acetyltransferase (RNA polymerase elongator complex component)